MRPSFPMQNTSGYHRVLLHIGLSEQLETAVIKGRAHTEGLLRAIRQCSLLGQENLVLSWKSGHQGGGTEGLLLQLGRASGSLCRREEAGMFQPIFLKFGKAHFLYLEPLHMCVIFLRDSTAEEVFLPVLERKGNASSKVPTP